MANNYGVSRRTLLGVGGLMLGVGLVGCSDSEEGWESVTVDRITVSHPTEWVEKPPENENFTKNFTDGPHGMQIAGHYSDDTEPTLAWSVLEFMIRGTFQGYDPNKTCRPHLPIPHSHNTYPIPHTNKAPRATTRAHLTREH